MSDASIRDGSGTDGSGAEAPGADTSGVGGSGDPLGWALPQLARALWAGHPSHRPRILRVLGRCSDEALADPTIVETIERILDGEDPELIRVVGAFVARRRLGAFGPHLATLLRDPTRRERAVGWLATRGFPLPIRELTGLALDRKADVGARLSALELVVRLDLQRSERTEFLPCLAEQGLHRPLLKLLRPIADEQLVEAAIRANRYHGEKLWVERRYQATGRHDPPWWERLFPPKPSSLGVWPSLRAQQLGFVVGIAKLAIEAGSVRWLNALYPFLFEAGLTAPLKRAFVEHKVTQVSAPLLDWEEAWRDGKRRAITIELLGELGLGAAYARVRRSLPALGVAADPEGRAAIVCLARLGDRAAVQPYLDGTLTALKAGMGETVEDAAAAGHPSTHTPSLEAAVILEDERFAAPLVASLTHDEEPNRVQLAGRVDALLAFDPVDLQPAVKRALSSDHSNVPACYDALALIGHKGYRELVDAVLDFVEGDPDYSDEAADCLRRLLRAGDEGWVKRLVSIAEPSDKHLLPLLRRAEEVFGREEVFAIAELVLRERNGGPRSQRWCLRTLRDGSAETFLDVCVRLLNSDHDAVRTAALREAIGLGLLGTSAAQRAQQLPAESDSEGAPEEDAEEDAEAERPEDAEEEAEEDAEEEAPEAGSGAVDSELAERLRDRAAQDLVALLKEGLEQYRDSGAARRQVNLVLDTLLPSEGVSGEEDAEVLEGEASDEEIAEASSDKAPAEALELGADEVEELRERVRQVGLWTEMATFHAFHRELLELNDGGIDLGLLHGAVLQLMGERVFQNPLTMKRSQYEGPLPRFDEAFGRSSAFVQEGLFDLIQNPGYLRTDGLLVRFLESPRTRVKQAALGALSREAVLTHAEAVLDQVFDPAEGVRLAVVELLRRHDLARYAGELRGLLEDSDPAVALATARTLAGWGDRSCLERLVEFLDSEDATLRAEAVRHLRRFDPEALVGLLADRVDVGRPRSAAAALAALRPQRLPDDEDLHKAIFGVAAQGSGPLRGRALRFLPDVAEGERLASAVPLLADDDREVRAATAFVLRRRDGRKLAPKIAEVAAGLDDAARRLEILGLLADLGASDAARGLLALLLDDDARVRQATRAAVGAARGFSLRDDLEALLRRGLDGGASPEALAELVASLDREGGSDSEAAVAEALRCEERVVWESVVEVMRGRNSREHLGRLVEALRATPPVGAGLQGLALSEIGRLQYAEAAETVKAVAEASDSPTIQRQAVEVLARLGSESHTALAESVAAAALKQIKQVEEGLKQTPEKRTKAQLTQEKRKLAQWRGVLTTCARASVRTATDGKALAAAWKGTPVEARRGTVPALAVSRAQALVAEGGTAEPALKAFDKTLRGVGSVQDPAGAVLLGLRDRLGADEWLKHAKAWHAEDSDPLTRARVAARFHRDAEADLAWIRTQLKSSGKAIEGLLLGAMESWKPELRAVFPDMVEAERAWLEGQPTWSRRYRAQESFKRYATVQVRLRLTEGSKGVLTIAEYAEDAAASDRLLGALDDAKGLIEIYASGHGTSNLERRCRLLLLMAETGSAEGLAFLAERVAEPDLPVDELVAATQGLSALPKEEARPYLEDLLGREQDAVVCAAIEAVRVLEDEALATEVAQRVLDDSKAVAEAACATVLELKVTAARSNLAQALSGSAQEAAARALVELADASCVAAMVGCLDSNPNQATAELLVEGLVKATPDDRLDEVGELLGHKKAKVIRSALAVVGRRAHTKAAPGVRDLLHHGTPEVRAAACEASAQLGDREALARLAELAQPKQESRIDVRQAAVRALAALAETPGERRSTLCGYLSDASVEPTAWALLAEGEPTAELVDRAYGRAWELLAPDVGVVGPDEDASVLSARLASADLLRYGEDEDGGRSLRGIVTGFVAWSEHEQVGEQSERACKRVVQLLWKLALEPFSPPGALLALEPYLERHEDEDDRQRLRGLKGSGTLHWSARGIVDRLLESSDPREGLHGRLQHLRQQYRPSADDTIAVVEGLAEAIRAGSTEWTPTLREFLLDESRQVRQAARAALRDAGGAE